MSSWVSESVAKWWETATFFWSAVLKKDDDVEFGDDDFVVLRCVLSRFSHPALNTVRVLSRRTLQFNPIPDGRVGHSAEKVGVKPGMRCVEINGTPVSSAEDLRETMAALDPGTGLELLFAIPAFQEPALTEVTAQTRHDETKTKPPSQHPGSRSSETSLQVTPTSQVVSLASHKQVARDLEAQIQLVRQRMLQEVDNRERMVVGAIDELEAATEALASAREEAQQAKAEAERCRVEVLSFSEERDLHAERHQKCSLEAVEAQQALQDDGDEPQ